MRSFKVLLMSGLPLHKKTSFNRQLNLLALFLNKSECEAIVTGPLKQIDCINHKTGAGAAVLLGYPDQFPFLRSGREVEIPLFLWAQFSRTPERFTLGDAIPVPLTPKTRFYLGESGHPNIGPTIPHGVDLSIFHPLSGKERYATKEEWGIGDRFVIGSEGANTTRKKFDKIIESFSLFSKNREAFLIIKTDRIVSIDGVDLEKLARKYGVLSCCKFIDEELNDEQMRKFYGIMDAYINLSEWEGFCIPIIESMACGIPVVTLPTQGPGEILPYEDLMVSKYTTIKEGGTPLTIADPQEAAGSLRKAADNPLLLKRLKKIGRETAKAKYDIRHIAQLWIDLIRSSSCNPVKA